MGTSIARSAISSVICTTRRVIVRLAVGGRDRIRVATDWNIDTGELGRDVEVSWALVSAYSLEYAQEFYWALGEALGVAKDLERLLKDDEIAGGLGGAADYVLLTFLLKKGEEWAYTRGRELTGKESPRVLDLARLRERAREVYRGEA